MLGFLFSFGGQGGCAETLRFEKLLFQRLLNCVKKLDLSGNDVVQ
jgi:hypothetical protein